MKLTSAKISTVALGFGLIVGSGEVLACQCEETDPGKRLQNAETVVEGKFTSMKAGKDVDIGDPTTGSAQLVVQGTLVVDRVLKGKAPHKISVVTGFGWGDCGSAGLILSSIYLDEKVQIEVNPVGGKDPRFVTDDCSYQKMDETNKSSNPN